MELNLNGTDALKGGDKGYNGDTEGAYEVEFITPRSLGLKHEVTGERVEMFLTEAKEQDWRWFRD